jgi:hypothetical protein
MTNRWALLMLGLLWANAAAAAPYPKWYRKPPAMCGVGSAPIGPGGLEMSKVSADNMARTDLARQVQTRVQAMVKDYGAQFMKDGAGDGEVAVTSVARNITDLSLTGGRSMRNEPKKDTMYVLVCLQRARFKKALDGVPALDRAMRNEVDARVDEAFDEMEAKLKKYKIDL